MSKIKEQIKQNRTLCIAAVLIGAVTGVIITSVSGTYAYKKTFSPGNGEGRIYRHLQKNLDLTETQGEMVRGIISNRHEKMREIMHRTDPEIRQIFNEGLAEIEAVLTPAQIAKWRPMREKIETRGKGISGKKHCYGPHHRRRDPKK